MFNKFRDQFERKLPLPRVPQQPRAPQPRSRLRSNTRPPDPVIEQATHLFERHSQELLDQAQAFIRHQFATTNGQALPNQSSTANESAPPAPLYRDFIRQRRNSLAQQMDADRRFGEWQDEIFKAETAFAVQAHSKLPPELLPPVPRTGQLQPTPDADAEIISHYLKRANFSTPESTDENYRPSAPTEPQDTD